MAPTNCQAESRASCVSVSRVITYFTFAKTWFHQRQARSDPLGICPAAQKRIQIRKFAAFALVSHPDPVLRIPSARAMKQEERWSPSGLWYLLFSASILCRASRNSGSSSGSDSSTASRKSVRQAEVQVVIPIGQEADFQRLDQLLDVLVLVSIVGTTISVRNSGGIPWRSPCAAADAASPSTLPASSPRRPPDDWCTEARAPGQPESPTLQPTGICLGREARGENHVSSRIVPP